MRAHPAPVSSRASKLSSSSPLHRPRLCSLPQLLPLLLLLALLSLPTPTAALIVRASPSVGPLEFPHHFALFGARSPDVTAPLVVFDSLAASLDLPYLPELCSFPPLNSSLLSQLSGGVFLILRSYESSPAFCNFDAKVNISQAMGAAAVIVGNVAAMEGAEGKHYGDELIIMLERDETAGQYNLTIDSVFVTHSTYTQLVELYHSADGDVEVTIGEEFDAAGELGFMRRLSVLLPFGAAIASAVLFLQNLRDHHTRQRRRDEAEAARIREADARQQQQQLADSLARVRAGAPPLAAASASLTFIPDPSASRVRSPAPSLPRAQSDGYTAVAVHEEDAKDDAHPSIDVTHSDDETLSDDELQGLSAGAGGDEEDAMDEFFDSPSRSCWQWWDELVVRLLSALAKPRAILLFNAAAYAVHIAASLLCLWLWSGEKCSNDLQALSSLFFCRAVIGLRIAYWQTHSDTPTPSCHEVFVKNWCDYVFLFTGSIQVWSVSGNNCSLLAPHLLLFSRAFVLTIYATFAARILLFLYIKLSALHQSIAEQEAAEISQAPASSSSSSSPPTSPPTHSPYTSHPPSSHLLSFARALLDVVNGGFYCAGPLDTARPATPLDLRSLPTIRYKRGLSRGRVAGEEDVSCIICMMEYEEGDVLRLLYCKHYYHVQCVDQWLMRNATCPQCRATVDKEKGEQLVKERRERRERRRRRMEREARRRREDEEEEEESAATEMHTIAVGDDQHPQSAHDDASHVAVEVV